LYEVRTRWSPGWVQCRNTRSWNPGGTLGPKPPQATLTGKGLGTPARTGRKQTQTRAASVRSAAPPHTLSWLRGPPATTMVWFGNNLLRPASVKSHFFREDRGDPVPSDRSLVVHGPKDAGSAPSSTRDPGRAGGGRLCPLPKDVRGRSV